LPAIFLLNSSASITRNGTQVLPRAFDRDGAWNSSYSSGRALFEEYCSGGHGEHGKGGLGLPLNLQSFLTIADTGYLVRSMRHGSRKHSNSRNPSSEVHFFAMAINSSIAICLGRRMSSSDAGRSRWFRPSCAATGLTFLHIARLFHALSGELFKAGERAHGVEIIVQDRDFHGFPTGQFSIQSTI